MVSEKLMKELNDQMNFEFLSGYYYMGMAGYASHEALDGFAHFFIMQGQEEYVHGMKFYEFINDIGGRVEFQEFDKPQNEFDSIAEAFELALDHEKIVTERINKLMDLAIEESNHAVIGFLDWFVKEQIEEEASMDTILTKLKRIDGNYQGIYMLDKELGMRQSDLDPNNPSFTED